MILKNKVYDTLKYIAMIVLPASAALYVGLGQLWGWPDTKQVVGSITLVDAFLGTLLQISTSQYNNSDASHDGYLHVTGNDPDTGIPNLQMTITSPPNEVLASGTVRLKAGPPPGQD